MADAQAAMDEVITCPYCGDNVSTLVPVEAGMRLRLQKEAQIMSVPERVCEGCIKQLAKSISKGAILRAEQRAKEQNRLMLWRSRVQLVKQAKQHLSQKNFSDAAVSYEKYLRVLEIIYEKKPGELSPDLFKGEARSQELTVIASVYWDLMRIYDTHERYKDRQFKAADKLAEFARFTPAFPHIMRRAESYVRQAKNPAAFKNFIRMANSSRPRCFIATAAFDGYYDPVVETLCQFRDQRMKSNQFGRGCINLYYRCSPRVAEFLDAHPSLKPATRKALGCLAYWITKCGLVRKGFTP